MLKLTSLTSGPPAMKLITMVQVSGVDDQEEAIIAKLLTVSSHNTVSVMLQHANRGVLDLIPCFSSALLHCGWKSQSYPGIGIINLGR